MFINLVNYERRIACPCLRIRSHAISIAAAQKIPVWFFCKTRLTVYVLVSRSGLGPFLFMRFFLNLVVITDCGCVQGKL